MAFLSNLRVLLLCFTFFCAGAPRPASAEPVDGQTATSVPVRSFKKIPAETIPDSMENRDPVALPFSMDMRQLQAEGERTLIVTLNVPEAHYIYANSPLVDKPTTLTLLTSRDADGSPQHLPPLTVLYPPAVERADIFDPQKRVPAYEGRVSFFLRLPQPSLLDTTSLHVSLLLCSAKNCRPVDQTFALNSDIPPVPPDAQAEMLTLLQQARPAASAATSLTPPANTATQPDSAAEFPPKLAPRFSDPALEPTALFTALWLGLLAGLVLNVMPCVLPVLTIKITALLGAAGQGDDRKRLARFREHNLCFAAGIISWFICLALGISLLDLAWGGLFQQVGVVYGLLILVFLLGLSLFDVFTLPVLDFKVTSTASPRLQAYLSGVVVTLLATPCSGPLLGGVLGWAASQPAASVVLVFVSTGVGMALPYLALAINPAVSRRLPRPGAWTGVVERLAGFFLMGTALYLLSVLPQSLRMSALAVLLTAALAAWVWGRWGSLTSPRRQWLVGSLCTALVICAIALSLRPSPAPAPWIPFSQTAFNRELGKAPLLVEFTADWCPTCKLLEQTVLTPQRLRTLTEAHGLQLMKVDMTRPDPAAEALLRALGSVSIPVTAIFPAGDAAAPVVLRDLYSVHALEQAVREATH